MSLTPGTIVRIHFGFYSHPGIVSDKKHDAMPMVISNSQRKRGVYEETWEEFCNGRPVDILDYPGSLAPAEVLQRARSKIGTRWNLLTWNCEHFIRFAHGLKPRSPQVRAYAGCAVAIAGLAVLFSKGRSKAV